MLLIVGTIRVPAQNLQAALPAMQAMVTASRAEPGCTEYAYAQDVLEPGVIHVRELWQSQQALDAHFASAHLLRWRDAWAALGIGQRNLRLYDVGAPRAT